MVSLSSGRVVPKTCKKWTCPDCSQWLRGAAREYLIAGCAATDHAAYSLTLLTLTDTAAGELDLPGLHRQWKATQKRLSRSFGTAGYGQAIELQRRLALHPHVILRTPRDVAQLLPAWKQERRTRDQWQLHFKQLVPMVRELGWGQMVDWRRIDGPLSEVSGYAVKSLAGYATKQAHAAFKAAGAKRIRPIRASRDWTPGATFETFKTGARADPGPWQDVTSVCAAL
jgi:hypothetical protein